MKQRALTSQQHRLLAMRQQGCSTEAIARALGAHFDTVRKKEVALSRGLKKNAYIIPDELRQLQQPGLFSEVQP